MILRIATVLIILATGINSANAITAKVLSVYDGDTLNVDVQGERVSIRLYGIDAPESGQDGNASATLFLKRLILGYTVEITMMEGALNRQSLAIVIRQGRESSVNAAMVANGYSWVNPENCRAEKCAYWTKLESQARKYKLGIWSGFDLVPPWEFKREGP